MKSLPPFILTLLLAFMALIMLPACSSTEESSDTSDTSDTQETVNCDQAFSSEERQKCLEQLGN